MQSPVPAGGLGQVLAPPPSTRAPGAFASPMLSAGEGELRAARGDGFSAAEPGLLRVLRAIFFTFPSAEC